MSDCIYCTGVKQSEITASSPYSFAFCDREALDLEHTLVVPVRHVADLFELNAREYSDLWGLVHDVHSNLAARRHPVGFKIGANIGRAAGQVIDHAHVLVIPC